MPASDRSHYGKSAIWLAVLAFLALLFQFAVPHAFISPGDEVEDRVIERSEVTQYSHHSQADPEVATMGLVLMAIAAASLVILGYVPIGDAGARWSGWVFATMGAIGSLVALFSSMFWVGDGFSLLINTFMDSHTGPSFWIIAPFPIALCAAVSLLFFMRIAHDVIHLTAGNRDRARRHNRGAIWALLFACMVLLVPWTAQEFGGEPRWISPHQATVLAADNGTHNMTFAFPPSTGQPQFVDLANDLQVFQATVWVSISISLAVALGNLLGAQMGHGIARWPPLLAIVTWGMLTWVLVLYVLTWTTHWHPDWNGSSDDWMPGIFPLLVLFVLLPWYIHRMMGIKADLADLRQVDLMSEKGRIKFD